jgi:hypothetical protein
LSLRQHEVERIEANEFDEEALKAGADEVPTENVTYNFRVTRAYTGVG